MAVPRCLPTSNEWEFLLLLDSQALGVISVLDLAILIGVSWYFIVVLRRGFFVPNYSLVQADVLLFGTVLFIIRARGSFHFCI